MDRKRNSGKNRKQWGKEYKSEKPKEESDLRKGDQCMKCCFDVKYDGDKDMLFGAWLHEKKPG